MIHFSQAVPGTSHCSLVSSLLVLPRSSCKSSCLLFFRGSSGPLSLGHQLTHIEVNGSGHGEFMLLTCTIPLPYKETEYFNHEAAKQFTNPALHLLSSVQKKKKVFKAKLETVRKLKEGEERRQESILENAASEIECIIHPGVCTVSRGRCDCAGCDNSSFSVTLLLYQMCSASSLYLDVHWRQF